MATMIGLPALPVATCGAPLFVVTGVEWRDGGVAACSSSLDRALPALNPTDP
jgi:hypothetical protein